MNDLLRQRLVGALILVALGVIFWPIIFVDQEREEHFEHRPIPERPSIDTREVQPPSEADLRHAPVTAVDESRLTEMRNEQSPRTVAADVAAQPNATSASNKNDAEPLAPKSPKPAKPEPRKPDPKKPQPLTVDANGAPVAWMLQVVSVSSQEKAHSLRDRLLAMDLKAYTKPVESGGKRLYRVYIGPKFEREELERVKPKVDAEIGVSSLVVRYVP